MHFDKILWWRSCIVSLLWERELDNSDTTHDHPPGPFTINHQSSQIQMTHEYVNTSLPPGPELDNKSIIHYPACWIPMGIEQFESKNTKKYDEHLDISLGIPSIHQQLCQRSHWGETQWTQLFSESHTTRQTLSNSADTNITLLP